MPLQDLFGSLDNLTGGSLSDALSNATDVASNAGDVFSNLGSNPADIAQLLIYIKKEKNND